MGFSRQGYRSGLLCPPPGDLPQPGIDPASLMFPALAGRLFTTNATWEAILCLAVSRLDNSLQGNYDLQIKADTMPALLLTFELRMDFIFLKGL